VKAHKPVVKQNPSLLSRIFGGIFGSSQEKEIVKPEINLSSSRYHERNTQDQHQDLRDPRAQERFKNSSQEQAYGKSNPQKPNFLKKK
jgi:hypothetical protein